MMASRWFDGLSSCDLMPTLMPIGRKLTMTRAASSALPNDVATLADLLARVRLRIVLEDDHEAVPQELPQQDDPEMHPYARRLLLRIREVAELLAISSTAAYALVGSGELQSIRVGRSRRISMEALREWVRKSSLVDDVRERHLRKPPIARPRSVMVHTAPSERRRPIPALAKRAPDEDVPFFRPWMPGPMKKAEYATWVAHLDAHPEEKDRVLEAMARFDALR
jgi:excisionase family DNA binding protein